MVFFEDLAVPGHVDRTLYLITMAGGIRTRWITGWCRSCWARWRRVRLRLAQRAGEVETNRGPNISTRTRWGMAFLGGAIMGYGARFARGCTSARPLRWSDLSLGSWAFMFSVFAGAYALAYFVRKLWN